MKRIDYPDISQWIALAKRPVMEVADVFPVVNKIFTEVKLNGDEALLRYTKEFDKVVLRNIEASTEEITEAESEVSQALKEAINLAYANILKFHASQKEEIKEIETQPGVFCWRESRAIEKVGIYIPGGTAPLFSTVLMLGIPAKLAGCKQIVLCSPPDIKGKIHPAILYAAKLVGVTSVIKLGGIQAIAAMALGTESVQRVKKIFGPGNQYVMAAKQVAQHFGVAIDMPAGPSEVLIIADETAVPEFVAADLLSQAEHGADSQVILLTTSETILKNVEAAIQKQIEELPRKSIAQKALSNSKAIIFNTIEECIGFSNTYAPEHLILVVKDAGKWVGEIMNAGSVFIGNYSCESAGDYASGTNHTLPTNGYATSYSGVSLDSFYKKITFQQITAQGIKNIGQSIEIMADAEGLQAHKNAVTVRLKSL